MWSLVERGDGQHLPWERFLEGWEGMFVMVSYRQFQLRQKWSLESCKGFVGMLRELCSLSHHFGPKNDAFMPQIGKSDQTLSVLNESQDGATRNELPFHFHSRESVDQCSSSLK